MLTIFGKGIRLECRRLKLSSPLSIYGQSEHAVAHILVNEQNLVMFDEANSQLSQDQLVQIPIEQFFLTLENHDNVVVLNLLPHIKDAEIEKPSWEKLMQFLHNNVPPLPEK